MTHTPTHTPTLLGWTWEAHFRDLHADVAAERWVKVAKRLALMLSYAIDKIEKNSVPVGMTPEGEQS